MVNAWIVALVGIWIVISAFLRMPGAGGSWNDWVFGAIAAVLGFTIAGPNRVWERTLAGLVGVWLFITGFVPQLRMGHSMMGNDVVIGILLIIAGFAATRGAHALPPTAPTMR